MFELLESCSGCIISTHKSLTAAVNKGRKVAPLYSGAYYPEVIYVKVDGRTVGHFTNDGLFFATAR